MADETSSYWSFTQIPRPQDIQDWAHAEVLVADSRLDQGGIRAAVDAVFEANPALGAVFEPRCDRWMARPGGSWTWAVEPPGVAVAEVIARQRASFDMRTGRLFAVSLLPGAPERLVLTASHLCVDGQSWQTVVEDLITEYDEGALAPEAAYHA
ncbi:hypothetical protein [Mycobacterium riyadhense]|uniref:Condensation domain-containing protein n=1 Tax=Mycobacterium riyadhense TaxID=486698 RepID=A0A1X2CK35_9MYCO|nr:hypothetical protein [Mycobacterium riyadhense]ORW76153.1 hypothetical protein AWC22_21765 [Mycobacterium riyadhense]VTO95093.1 Linear gramicidin synthase subunit B [Mycobacterium riyadhense]